MRSSSTRLPSLAALALFLIGCGVGDPPEQPPSSSADLGAPPTRDMRAEAPGPDMVEDVAEDMAAAPVDMAMPLDLGGEDSEDMAPEMSEAPPACPDAGLPPAPGLVPTESGLVQGQRDGDSWSFLGIPYAASPVGERRWRPPADPGCFEAQPLRADAFGPKCPQAPGDAFVGEEDCLHLNVWTPEGYDPSDPRPVLVFIHGGGNSQGSASQPVFMGVDAPIYGGQHFASREGVVLVTLQYRLGPLGYLALEELSAESGRSSSGTYGHLDQIAALEWVRDNIAAFGGDPDDVMIFGESAGAVNVCTLVASPLAAGLFDAALMQSGACSSQPIEESEAQGAEAVATIEACAGQSGAALTACLRGLDAQTLVEAIPGSIGFSLTPGDAGDAITYGPVIDGELLTRDPYQVLADGAHNHVDLVVGSNSDEFDGPLLQVDPQTPQQYEQIVRATGAAFGPGAADRILATYPAAAYDTPRDALVQVLTDAWFTCATRRIARLSAASQQRPVYRYFFTKRTPTRQGARPATHGIELLYVFYTLTDIPGIMPPADVLSLAEQMTTRWAALGRSGAPDASPDAAAWETYDPARDETLELGDAVQMREGVRGEECDLWDDLYRW